MPAEAEEVHAPATIDVVTVTLKKSDDPDRDAGLLDDLDRIAARFAGQSELQLVVVGDGEQSKLRWRRRVTASDDLVAQLRNPFGAEAVEVSRSPAGVAG